MKRRLKNRLAGIGLAAMMVFTFVAGFIGAPAAARADEGAVIKLHYNRPDGDYGPWRVWFWEDGAEGGDYYFEEVDGEQIATMNVSPGAAKIGFIVRTEDWTKDVNKDQFIDIPEVISGTVHVYVEAGVEGFTKEYGEDVVTGVKLMSAVYGNDGTVAVELTAPIEQPETAFVISGSEGEIGIVGVEGTDTSYTLTLEAELNSFGNYTITFDGNDYSVKMPSVYSTGAFEAAYTYSGDDLGAVWTPEKTTFRVWAPVAEEVYVNLYQSGDAEAQDLIESIAMTQDVNGTWVLEAEGDKNGVYYTYKTVTAGQETEACDPYARTTGVNGDRAMVIDLDSTDPEGWENDSNPHAGEKITDAIIYELHMRDFSADASSGIENVGKYLQFTEKGTSTAGGAVTGIDYLKELGVTHLHILPMYDFGSVDETGSGYNWGYDPKNYNVPEGSYSTDPYNGAVRVNEVKQMVQSLHNEGIGVVMDVVYNHVQSAEDFCFNRLVPGYFSRITESGSYSNGSGCGNDTASERSMVRKYIVDSVCYWADEYHIDGFRFDLVGLLDADTVNKIVEEVHKTHPDVIFYGEGWTMTTNVTKQGVTMATQENSAQTPGFAYFNDKIRDGLKGGVFSETETGYISGASSSYEVARAFQGNSAWCGSPAQTINYASCHDNLSLFDKLQRSRSDASREDLIRMNNLAAAIYMTSQGVPFMQAGEEMLRTKVNADGSLNSNSYNAGDEVNSIKWSDLEKEEYRQVLDYYKGLIAFRKAHSVLRLDDAQAVKEHVSRVEDVPQNVLAFDLTGGVEGEIAEEMFVVFNPNTESVEVNLPAGGWSVYINGEKAGTEALEGVSGKVSVASISAMVLIKDDSVPVTEQTDASGETSAEETAAEPAQKEGVSVVLIGVICAAVLAVAGIVLIVLGKGKKNKK
ncbi:MAG: type I pullulanase [Firmicutes bacterium]|nr:type I pullulanase [Bacillota bacterium]